MKMQLTFSIVITTYNRLSLLEKAIATSLRQTLPALEVIVVDDGSSDGTQDYVRQLAARDARVKYIRNETNLGHSGSVNRGVAAAAGDWIKFLDDDDYLAPNCLETIAVAIARAQAMTCDDIALCSVQAHQEYLDGRIFDRTCLPVPIAARSLTAETDDTGYLVEQEDVHYNMLVERLPFGTPVQVACSRKAFEAAGGWNPDFDGNCDDIEFWVRAANYGAAVVLHAAVAHRTHGYGNVSASLSEVARCATNTTIKQKIYPCVSLKYSNALPDICDVKGLLNTHWAMVSVKNKHAHEATALLGLVLREPSYVLKYLSDRLNRV